MLVVPTITPANDDGGQAQMTITKKLNLRPETLALRRLQAMRSLWDLSEGKRELMVTAFLIEGSRKEAEELLRMLRFDDRLAIAYDFQWCGLHLDLAGPVIERARRRAAREWARGAAERREGAARRGVATRRANRELLCETEAAERERERGREAEAASEPASRMVH
jgi:hypothetical protein